MTDRFVDYQGGNNANDGTSFANRVLTIDASGMTAARHAAGDTIKIMKSPDPTTLSTTALWTNASSTITLTTAVTQTIDMGSSWTKAANVSGTTATAKLGGSVVATNLIIAGAFGTGIVAYKDLGSTIDFSAYQQISFWFGTDTAIAASTFRIDLCSDAIGAVPVNSLTITTAAKAFRNKPIVLDNGSALSATVRSITLYALLDPGAVTVTLNGIFAAKAPSSADCLTLYSLLSKSNAPTGVTGWYRPCSINGTTIKYDQALATAAGSAIVYEGTTETVTTYVRQCIPIFVTASLATIQKTGTEGNYITYSGGWDTTAMTSRTGETWLFDISGDASTPTQGYDTNGMSFIAFDRIGIVASPGMAFQDTGPSLNISLTNCWAVGCVSFTSSSSSSGGWTWDHCYCFNSTAASWAGLNTVTFLRQNFASCVVVGSAANGISQIGRTAFFKNCIVRKAGIGMLFSASAGSNTDEYQLDSCAISATSGAAISYTNTIKCINTTITGTITSPGDGFEQALYSINDGGVVGATVITGFSHIITQQASVRHTASGTAWKIAVTSTIYTAMNPCRLQVAQFYVSAGTLVTVTAWIRRDSTNLTMKLVAPVQGGIITTEATTTASASVNTWGQETITFTPAIAGVVQIWVLASGGSTNLGYVDDLGISQA